MSFLINNENFMIKNQLLSLISKLKTIELDEEYIASVQLLAKETQWVGFAIEHYNVTNIKVTLYSISGKDMELIF